MCPAARSWRSGLLCPLAMLVEEWVIVPARVGVGYARVGVGYCARSWRSGLLCLLVEEWVIVPARRGVGYCARWALRVKEWVIVPARRGVGYCARWLCAWRSGLLCPLVEEWVIVSAGFARGGVGYRARS